MAEGANFFMNHKVKDKSFGDSVILFSEYRQQEGKVIPFLEMWIQRKDESSSSGVKEMFGQFTIEAVDELIVRLIEHKINLEKAL